MGSFEPYRLTMDVVAVDTDRAFLASQLREWNNQHSPHHQYVRAHPPEPLDFFLRDATDVIVGGLTAETYWSWLAIDKLWLRDDVRGKGFGGQLLALAEQGARQRGCLWAQLTTFSFQARGFYEKAGYRVVGELADYPPGETYYWLRKDLSG